MLSPSRTGSHRLSTSPPPASFPRRQSLPHAPPHRPSTLLIPATQYPPHPHCLGIPLRFHLVHHDLKVHGYQMYAVEKWIVERNRPVTVLAVYTGDPSHKARPSSLLTQTLPTPSPDLSPSEARAEWDKALHHLRRDGARPKETPHGLLMATSLAHFRSDYTIVHIPDGNFLAVREQLYTNINLLRMGCSGRSALTLEDPSDATKSRFISTYHLPHSISSQPGPVTSTENLAPPITISRSHSHSHSASVLNFTPASKHTPEIAASPPSSVSKANTNAGLGPPSTVASSSTSATVSKGKTTKDNTLFIATVLELVKLIQAGLTIFGMYGAVPGTTAVFPCFDGLLCDETVDGIRRWIIDVGEPCVGLEPMERIADPMFVAALLSLILTVRNKLAALGFSQLVPKDPFLHPHIFTCALTAYIQATNPPAAASNPAIALSHSPPTTHQHPYFLTPNASSSHSNPTTPSHSHHGHSSYGFGSPHFGGYMFPPYPHHLVPPPHPRAHPTPSPSQITPSTSGSSTSNSNPNSNTPPAAPSQVVLTRELVDAIGAAYDVKMRAPDGRVGGHGGRMRKALREKLRAGVDSDGDGGGAAGAGYERAGGAMSGGEGGGCGMGIVGGNRERERDSLGGVGMGVSSSGGQILSGIGSFASGLGLGVGAGSGSSATGAGALLEPTYDLAWLVKSVYGKEGKGRGRKAIGMGKERRGKERKSDAGDLLGVGYTHGYSGKEKDKDGSVGVSVRALWSGQVTSIVRLREWEIEKGKMGSSSSIAGRKRERVSIRERGALSDGDVDDALAATAKSETEEESDVAIQNGSFGGMWGEKVQKKIESWKGIARKRAHMSLDLSTPASRGYTNDSPGNKNAYASVADPLLTARPNLPRAGSMPLSPTLPPTTFGGGEADADDDDLLSSGQVSPIDNLRPSPFHLPHDGRSFESTSFTTHTNTDYERKVIEFNQKRPWGNRMPKNRVSSWADPISARGILDEDSSDLEGKVGPTKPRRRTRGDTIGSWLGAASVLSEEPEEAWEDGEREWFEEEGGYEGSSRRMEMFGRTRRRSFHDLNSLQGMRPLPIECMRVDVELSGQLLIMSRREQHLENVLACLQVLTSTLSNSNTLLREDYTAHLPFLSDLEARTQVISTIDAENAKADKTSQATHTLRYEAEQFRIFDLWHTATPARQKVLALREKVFGTGGRRLPAGVHGAHGPFNRLQWTLDGQERLVDHLGRTESEAEEEAPGIPYLGSQEEEEEDVVQHPGIKPMWLLRFFTSWGARWGAPTPSAAQSGENDMGKGTPEVNEKGHGNGSAAQEAMPGGKDESMPPASLSS
ncbi:hypothetical protein D9615_000428 [Tricholomella constricta]|uniref:STB6-like N-terminal domain-containing protein n=1 Tax=Tricholomella constricta TaxID=117010 RepID=A0A8H5HRG1_9AGAR|nr:hypothetical protein D9615_000428 [Tricholomella constricta]